MQSSLSNRTKALIAVVALAVLVVGCRPDSPDGSGLETYRLVTIPLDEYWSAASEAALEWRSDAYIREVGIDVELPNSPASVSAINYFIESSSEDMVTLEVICTDGGCRAIETERNPGYPLAHCRAIELDDPEISSQEALAIALANGGRQYVYGKTSMALLSLSHTSGNRICSERLTWTAGFGDLTAPGIRVRMDAETGEILTYP